MAQDKDEYRIITTFPLTNATQYRQMLIDYMATKNVLYTTFDTGWGSSINQPARTIMVLSFTTDKNALSDAQANQIAADVVAILDGDVQLIAVQRVSLSRLN